MTDNNFTLRARKCLLDTTFNLRTFTNLFKSRQITNLNKIQIKENVKFNANQGGESVKKNFLTFS